MKLTRISPYGFQVDNKQDWNNYLKTLTSDKRFNKNDIGKDIDFRKDQNGRVVQCITLKSKPNKEEKIKTSSLLIKTLIIDDLTLLEGEYNAIAERINIKATTWNVVNNKFVGIIYYEPEL